MFCACFGGSSSRPSSPSALTQSTSSKSKRARTKNTRQTIATIDAFVLPTPEPVAIELDITPSTHPLSVSNGAGGGGGPRPLPRPPSPVDPIMGSASTTSLNASSMRRKERERERDEPRVVAFHRPGANKMRSKSNSTVTPPTSSAPPTSPSQQSQHVQQEGPRVLDATVRGVDEKRPRKQRSTPALPQTQAQRDRQQSSFGSISQDMLRASIDQRPSVDRRPSHDAHVGRRPSHDTGRTLHHAHSQSSLTSTHLLPAPMQLHVNRVELPPLAPPSPFMSAFDFGTGGSPRLGGGSSTASLPTSRRSNSLFGSLSLTGTSTTSAQDAVRMSNTSSIILPSPAQGKPYKVGVARVGEQAPHIDLLTGVVRDPPPKYEAG